MRSMVVSSLLVVGGVGFGGAAAEGQEVSLAGREASATVAVFREPAVLENAAAVPGRVELSLTASPRRMSLVAGTETDAYAYNGQVPGPTLQLREGDRVVVRFRNELPESTTVHWHGLHLPFSADGSPFHPVPPGGEHEYAFTVPAGTAGTYWYHPHPHHHTGMQVAKGLYGAIVVRAPDDPLPATLAEKLIILADNRFDERGAIDLPAPGTRGARIDFENGREGDVIFVNGVAAPALEIRSGEVQRWRVINASAARVYRLAIPGHRLLHVGSDGGLFEIPVDLDEITIANGERVELLVRGVGDPGARTALQALPYDRYIPQTRPRDWNTTRDLLAIHYSSAPKLAPIALPARLRPVPPLDTAAATATRVMALTQGMINGRLMDMARVDETAKLGATEIWEIRNLVGMDHPFHLHGFQFQLIDRNGEPVPYRSWKDTVNIPKHQSARFVVRYDNHPGKWMFHCHILDHEDHGMMGVLEVVP
jgi:FtsP/CotA-like multicopper oxidase with cupredoxin domain